MVIRKGLKILLVHYNLDIGYYIEKSLSRVGIKDIILLI
jgi:hypothetical protein